MSDILFLLSIFSILVSAQSSFTQPSDLAALQAFKSSIKPSSIPAFSCLASWNFTAGDPCSQPRVNYFTCGVFCNGNRVIHITLDSAGYSGELSPLISSLNQLISLDISKNKFYGSLPEMSSMASLQTLILQFNSFSGSLPPSLTSLKSLDRLDLAFNSFSGSLPSSMSSLINLRKLDLSFNKFTGALPKLPPNLISLAVKANLLSGFLDKSTFRGLNQLEVVELSDNSLTGALGAWFFLLPSLQQADLANNSFTRVEIRKPDNRDSSLVAVDLGYNKLEGTAPVNLAAYPVLSSLSLRYNRLRGPIPWEYSKKETLKRLYLDGNFLNGSPPAGFFIGGASFSGSLGDNCLQSCPISSQLCAKAQKPASICRQLYRGKPRS